MNEHGINFFKKKIIKEWNNTVRMADTYFIPCRFTRGLPYLVLLVLRKNFTQSFYPQSIYPQSTLLHPVFGYFKRYHLNFSLMHI